PPAWSSSSTWRSTCSTHCSTPGSKRDDPVLQPRTQPPRQPCVRGRLARAMIQQTFWHGFVASRVGPLGLAILALVLALALSAPLASPGAPLTIVDKPFSPPLQGHLLGTDSLGRDMAACIAHGAGTSLMIGLIATAVALLIGTLLGAFAGFYGGLVDNMLMR